MGINGICSQFCPTAPRGFCQFCGAGQGLLFTGRGSLFFPGAGQASLQITHQNCNRHSWHRGKEYEGCSTVCKNSKTTFPQWWENWAHWWNVKNDWKVRWKRWKQGEGCQWQGFPLPQCTTPPRHQMSCIRSKPLLVQNLVYPFIPSTSSNFLASFYLEFYKELAAILKKGVMGSEKSGT